MGALTWPKRGWGCSFPIGSAHPLLGSHDIRKTREYLGKKPWELVTMALMLLHLTVHLHMTQTDIKHAPRLSPAAQGRARASTSDVPTTGDCLYASLRRFLTPCHPCHRVPTDIGKKLGNKNAHGKCTKFGRKKKRKKKDAHGNFVYDHGILLTFKQNFGQILALFHQHIEIIHH